MSYGPFLLDTSIVLQLVRDKELGRRISAQFNLADTIHRPLISVVTVGEIWSLADQFNFGPIKREFLAKVLQTLVILDINDQSVFDAYVEIDRACRNARGGARILSKNDLWIASAAKAASAVLLTTDKDFLVLHPDPCAVQYVDPAMKA